MQPDYIVCSTIITNPGNDNYASLSAHFGKHTANFSIFHLFNQIFFNITMQIPISRHLKAHLIYI